MILLASLVGCRTVARIDTDVPELVLGRTAYALSGRPLDRNGAALDVPVDWAVSEPGIAEVSDASLRCLGRGEVALTARAGAVAVRTVVRCHPDATVSPSTVRAVAGGPVVPVEVRDGVDRLDVPIELVSTDPAVAVDGAGIHPVAPGSARVEVRAGGLRAEIDVGITVPLRRDRVYVIDPDGGCTFGTVDASGTFESLAVLDGCDPCPTVLLDLDNARVGWVRDTGNGPEAVSRWIGGSPVETLGPTEDGVPLGFDHGALVAVEPGGRRVRVGPAVLDLPDSARFVGTDASGRPCAAVGREYLSNRLWCGRADAWTEQPFVKENRALGMVDGGRAVLWVGEAGKHMPLTLSPIEGVGSPWPRDPMAQCDGTCVVMDGKGVQRLYEAGFFDGWALVPGTGSTGPAPELDAFYPGALSPDGGLLLAWRVDDGTRCGGRKPVVAPVGPLRERLQGGDAPVGVVPVALDRPLVKVPWQ